jgi:uroporphyrinogen-III synthase
VRLAAVDRTTANALREHGLLSEFIPAVQAGRDIATDIGGLTGQRVLLPCADIVSANPSAKSIIAEEGHLTSLADALRDQGAVVETVAAYTVQSAEPDLAALSALLDGNLDVATFTSRCGVTLLTKMLENRPVADVLSPLTVACISPTTANAARALGVRVDVVPEEHTIEGLVDALVKWRTEGRT